MNLAHHINEQARRVNIRPTEGQKRAGNYQKGHIRVHGLDITIENPKGSWRSGTSLSGKPWRSQLPHHYGYIKRTTGADGDHVDVFVGPHLKSPHVFVIDQHNVHGGRDFDEHKVFIGFGSKGQARAAYIAAFSDGRGAARIGHIAHLSIDGFKRWLQHGNTLQAIKRRADGGRIMLPQEDPYSTPLSLQDEARYQLWKIQNAPRDSGADYDLRGAFMAGETPAGNGHWVDTYKKPNHETFSDESRYAVGSDRARAGFWTGPDHSVFVPPAPYAAGGRVGYADGGAPAFDQTVAVPAFDETQPVEDAGKLDAAWRGARAGATFNMGDELSGIRANAAKVPEFLNVGPVPIPAKSIVGAAKTGYGYLTGDKGLTDTYEQARDAERKADKAAHENHPYVYAGSELAGAIPAMAALPEAGAAKALAPAARGIAKFGARTLDAAVKGGAYGGISGAGEGESAVDRAVRGATGLVSGIIGGAAGNVLGEGIGAAATKYGAPIVNTVRGWMDPNGEAARRLAAALRADQDLIQAGRAQGMTPQQWAAARANGEPVTLADLGSARTQALLRSAANTSPEGRAQLEQMLEQRFLEQGQRVAETVRNAIPGGRSNAGKTADQMVAEYDAGRTPLYQKAYQDGDKEIISPTIERLMGSPTFESAMKAAIQGGKDAAIGKEGMGAFNPGIRLDPGGAFVYTKSKPGGGPVYPNLQYWDAVKQNLDDIAQQAKQSGAFRKADVVSSMARILRGELDAQVPSYKAARGLAEQFFGEKNALEAGRKLAGKKMDPEAVEKMLRQMKPDERALFQEGYASDLANRVIGNMSDTTNIVKGRGILSSPNERRMAHAIFGPGGAAQLEARMHLERIMDGARQAMGNSTTARQLIEAGLAGGAVGGFASGWDPTEMGKAGLFGMGLRGGASKLLSEEVKVGAKHLIGKVDARTARRVAELLTSNDPRELRAGYQMAAKSARIMQGLRNIANRMALVGQTSTRQPATNAVRALQGPVGASADEQQQRP